MAYTKQTWATGDTITAAKLNHMEDGIEDGGSSYDAVILLTHAENSGNDDTTNITPSIVSGTYAACAAKLEAGTAPSILVKYHHELYDQRWAMSNVMVEYYTPDVSVPFFTFTVYGPIHGGSDPYGWGSFPSIDWDSTDQLAWS